jgi:hypothetical protein
MGIINGWSAEDIRLLGERTGQPAAAVEDFCRAVDKQLYMMLPNHIRRATLHFHLRAHAGISRFPTPPRVAEAKPSLKQSKQENIVRIQEYLQRRKA